MITKPLPVHCFIHDIKYLLFFFFVRLRQYEMLLLLNGGYRSREQTYEREASILSHDSHVKY